MEELKKNKKIEEFLFKKGPRHQKELQKLADEIKSKLDAEILFNKKTESELEDAIKSLDLKKLLENFYKNFKKLKASRSPGHELSHIIDNLNSLLRIFDEYGNFSKLEKLETIFACFGHDLGRYFEERLNKISPDDTLFLAPFLIGKEFYKKGILNIPEKLGLRVAFDIAFPVKGPTEHRTADVVHQCDREQLIGSVIIPRGLAFDVGISKMNLTTPLSDSFKYKLPYPESKEDNFWMLHNEFYMRNVYLPVSPKGIEITNRNKKEMAVLLMLDLEGKPKEFYEQVFGPELGISGKYDLSKQPISKEVFGEAVKEKEEFISSIDFSKYKKGCEAKLVKFLFDSNNIQKPEGFNKVLAKKLDALSDLERRNFCMILIYSIIKRHEHRLEDLKILESEDKDDITSIIKKWVIEELKEREKKYLKQKKLINKLFKK